MATAAEIARRIAEHQDVTYTDLVFNGDSMEGVEKADRDWLARTIEAAIQAEREKADAFVDALVLIEATARDWEGDLNDLREEITRITREALGEER